MGYLRLTYTASQHASPLRRTDHTKAAVAAHIVFATTSPHHGGVNGIEGVGQGMPTSLSHDLWCEVVRGDAPG
ncbi:hypothetical protein LN050_09745 [Comamonadaceae bacterium M7527]|nr:hypothetical protein LN050_09745 [Comamonadaceae bacterium M7527]